MRSQEIQQTFVDYFHHRGHRIWPSAPLVPHGDATLLFTNAGMVQFKDFFLGADTPPEPRAVSVQKCMRVSGKHNDLENVGPSPRHHTFFEMLGNFSFGDYFKDEAIQFGWELVTDGWGIDPSRLFATVFEEDDEAAELWSRISTLPSERILRCGAADNFWAMGDTGPCGPCSEIFVDMRPDAPAEDWSTGSENGRYLEIWNLVFMQFERHADGRLEALPNPSIDTGAGLERLAAVLQGVDSNYDTDLFQPILASTAALLRGTYGRDVVADVSYRVIADHLRAVAFLLADGVIPSNEGRGYVLRRVLRRAVRHGAKLGFEEPFLHRLLPVVEEVMGNRHPELASTRSASVATVEAEESKFLSTVASASRQVQEAIDTARGEGRTELGGPEVFRFYDTYGLPLEVIAEIAEEERFTLDRAGFDQELEEQRQRSRSAGAGSKDRVGTVREALRVEAELQPTKFVGYDALTVGDAQVTALARLKGSDATAVSRLETGEVGVAVLSRTPFYAESGGQVGDRGSLVSPSVRATVGDVQKDGAGTHFHFVSVEQGSLETGAVVSATVEPEWRLPTQRHHTATHLLHAALRKTLGDGVRQAGSLVAPDRLRFDFTFGRSLTDDEMRRVEDDVNAWILEGQATVITADRAVDEALAAGATALFGEKYGERVRTVEVPGGLGSFELCGGCHVDNTGQIGFFLLLSERGVASGVRRIEAVTGEAALAFARQQRSALNGLIGELGVAPERAVTEISARREAQRELEKELADLRLQFVAGGDTATHEAIEVEGVALLVREVPPVPADEMRTIADSLRSKLGTGIVVLGSRGDGKVTFVAAVSPDVSDRVRAGDLARDVAVLVDGKGGGRADFAQAGGRSPEKLPQALKAVPDLVRARLTKGAS